MTWEYDCLVEIIYVATGTTEKPKGLQAGIPASMVRVTHIPTGMMAQCGVTRTQHKQRQIALEMLEYGLLSVGCNLEEQ